MNIDNPIVIVMLGGVVLTSLTDKIKIMSLLTQECPFPSVEIVGMMDQDNPTVAMNAGSASAVHFAVTMSQECEATVLEQFTVRNLAFLRFRVIFSYNFR